MGALPWEHSTGFTAANPALISPRFPSPQMSQLLLSTTSLVEAIPVALSGPRRRLAQKSLDSGKQFPSSPVSHRDHPWTVLGLPLRWAWKQRQAMVFDPHCQPKSSPSGAERSVSPVVSSNGGFSTAACAALMSLHGVASPWKDLPQRRHHWRPLPWARRACAWQGSPESQPLFRDNG